MNIFTKFYHLLISAFLLANVCFAQQTNLSIADGPDMVSPHQGSVNFTLPNGNIIVMGGKDVNFVSSNIAEIYNPDSNKFTQLTMNYPHDNGWVMKLTNGKYLITAGSKNLGVAPGYNTTEIFDPADSSFTPAANLNYERTMCSGVQLSSGKVLIAGGWYNASSATYGEIYDVEADTYTLTGGLNTPRTAPVVLPTDDGGAAIFGGYNYYGSPMYEQVEYYDPSTNQFSVLSDTPFPSETGWFTYMLSYNTDFESLKMNDGKYLLFFFKSVTDTNEYALATFDPATKVLTKLNLNGSLKMVNTKGLYSLVLDKVNNIAYLPGLITNDPAIMIMYAVNLNTGVVYTDGINDTLDAGDYIMLPVFNLLNNGKILLTGVSSQNGTYFASTTKTLLYSIEIVEGVAKLEKDRLSIYPNPADDFICINSPVNGIQTLSILNLQGQLIRKEFINKGVSKLNIDELPIGMYILKLENQKDFTVNRFIKR